MAKTACLPDCAYPIVLSAQWSYKHGSARDTVIDHVTKLRVAIGRIATNHGAAQLSQIWSLISGDPPQALFPIILESTLIIIN